MQKKLELGVCRYEVQNESSSFKIRRLSFFCLSNVYNLSQFSVSRGHVESLAEGAAVVELIHRLQGKGMSHQKRDYWRSTLR
jgi:hypothetical protein